MAALVGEERREFQRLRLDPPLAGTFGSTSVKVMEIGVLGARIEHAEAIDQHYADMHFSFQGNDIGLRSELVRTVKRGDRSESGIRFLSAIDDAGERLRRMLADLVTHEFEVRRSVPRNTLSQSVAVDGDKTVRGKDAAFLCYRLEGNVWRKRRVFLPEQPKTGFTVARSEDSEEMQRLCRLYQSSDDEGRRLIRLFAELSVSDALEIPPQM